MGLAKLDRLRGLRTVALDELERCNSRAIRANIEYRLEHLESLIAKGERA